MRLPMKPGVSLQITTLLPSARSAKSRMFAVTSDLVAFARYQLQKPHYPRRVEEVGDEEVGGEALRQALRSTLARGNGQVLEETIEPTFRTPIHGVVEGSV